MHRDEYRIDNLKSANMYSEEKHKFNLKHSVFNILKQFAYDSHSLLLSKKYTKGM